MPVNLTPMRRLDLKRPELWTGDWVRDRLREAFEIERRLPRSTNSFPSGWPFPVIYEFADVVGWDDARARVWADWKRARGAYPYEVSRMEEAFGWFAILKDHAGERRCLAAWAIANTSVRAIVARRGWSRATFYRRVLGGSKRIADVLNARGEQVR